MGQPGRRPRRPAAGGGGRARAGGPAGRIAEPAEGAEPTARAGRARRRFPLLLLLAVVAMLVVLTACLPIAAADVGIAALAAGVADPALRNVMLSMWAEFEGQIAAERNDKEVLRADFHSMQGQIAAERNSKEAAVEAIRADLQGQIEAERRDKERLAGRVDRCEADMRELSNRTCSRSRLAAVEAGVAAIEAERKREGGEVASLVKAETASLVEHMERVDKHRRMQEAAQCQGEATQAMLAACCPAGGGGAGNGHRRQLQGGCSGFPASCSAECADLFVQYYEACQGMITAMAAGSSRSSKASLACAARSSSRSRWCWTAPPRP